MATVRRYKAAGGVILRHGRVLLLLRRENGEIRLPKGHVEPGEKARAAALREVAEETGFRDLRVAADLGKQTVNFRLGEEQVERVERYFRLELETLARQPRSPSDARRFGVFWADAAEALQLLTFEAEREFVRRALATRPT